MILLGIEIVIICALGYGIKQLFFDSSTRTTSLLTYEPNNYINNEIDNDINNDIDTDINSQIPPKYEDVINISNNSNNSNNNNSSSSLISLPLYE